MNRPTVCRRAAGCLAALAACLALAGCNAAPVIESTAIPAGGGVDAVNGGANAAVFDSNSYRVRTSGQLYQSDVTSEGASTFGESPAGIASIIRGDLNLTNAQDASFDALRIEYQDAVQIGSPDGPPALATPLRSIELTGFNGSGSAAITAGLARLQAHAAMAATYSGDAREAYLARVAQVDGPLIAGLVRLGELALTGGASSLIPRPDPSSPPDGPDGDDLVSPFPRDDGD